VTRAHLLERQVEFSFTHLLQSKVAQINQFTKLVGVISARVEIARSAAISCLVNGRSIARNS
jgi:hypothetical protein